MSPRVGLALTGAFALLCVIAWWGTQSEPEPPAVAPSDAPAAPLVVEAREPELPAAESDPTTPAVPYPETITLEKSEELDGKALLAAAVAALGGESFDRLAGIDFVRSSRFWRNGRIFTTEAPHTRTFLNSRIAGRVDVSTRNWIRSGKGRTVEFAVVENGGDRFCLKQRTQVMSTPTHEKQATAQYRIELIMFLAPWLAVQQGIAFHHEGHAVVDTWETGGYELPPKGFRYPKDASEVVPEFGWSGYEPIRREYEVVTVTMPLAWRSACGESIAFDLIDVDSQPRIARVRLESPDTRPEHTGREAIYWIKSWQEAGGIQFFKEVDVTWEGCALRSERQEFRDVALAPGLAEKDLERP